MSDTAERPDGPPGSRFGRRGLIFGGVSAALAAALGKTKAAAGSIISTGDGETVIEGDLLAGRFPHRLADSSSTAEVFPSTVRLYHITDPNFDPLGAALDRATLQVIEDDSLHSASRFSHFYANDGGSDLSAGPASNAMYDLSTPIPKGAPLDPATLQLLNFVPGRMPFTARNLAGADAATFEGNVDCDGDLVVRGQMFCSSIREAACPARSNRCLIQDADCKTTSFVAPMVSQDLGQNSLQQVIPGDGQVEFVFAKALRAPFTLSYLLLQRTP